MRPCYICNSRDNWEVLRDVHGTETMLICKEDGTLCHDVSDDREAKMFDYYRHQYRPAPTATNLITTGNKLAYIMKFLAPFLKDKKNLVTHDVGAATGYLVNALRQQGHRASGDELTVTFRRASEHFYGVPLSEKIDENKTYDLITCYHVLEHMTEPDVKLKKMASLLKKDGRIFLSTPYWLENIEEQSGGHLKSFDHLFHKDHINLFTRQNLRNLIAKCGLKVEREDHLCYGQTYILRKQDGVEKDIDIENWEEIKGKVLAQKEAINLFLDKKIPEAIAKWPLFPEAHMVLIFNIYGKDPDRQLAMIEEVPEQVRKTTKFMSTTAHWLNQHEKFEDALALMEKANEQRESVQIMFEAAKILYRIGDGKKALEILNLIAKKNFVLAPQAYDWMMKIASEMPNHQEIAEAALKEKVFSEFKEKEKAK